MSHLFRFIGERRPGKLWELTEDEAHHVAKVLRLAAGEAVEVCDGAGMWATGKIASITAKSVMIETDGEVKIERAPKAPLVMAIGALKPGAIDEVLPSLIELGVDAVHVFLQEGSAKMRLNESAQERWKRIAISAVKQCKRARIPSITGHESIRTLPSPEKGRAASRAFPEKGLATSAPSPEKAPSPTPIVLTPDATKSLREIVTPMPPNGVMLIVGCEKGLSDAELAILRECGAVPASLGQNILRAFTATIAAAAIASSARV